jgi:RNA polymerase sigma-70 factor (ECF subfamily)
MERAIVLEANQAQPVKLDLRDLLELEQRFSLFVGTHRERARRLAWRLVGGDDGAAEDVTQDAFVKAYQGLSTFREEARLETWFYRILVRQAHNYRRWRSVRETWGQLWNQKQTAENEQNGQNEHADHSNQAEPLAGQLAEQLSVSEQEYGDPFLRQRIAVALERLTHSQREAFILVHMEGFSVRECADMIGKPTGTVKSHLHRALTTLRTELADLRQLQPSPAEESRV